MTIYIIYGIIEVTTGDTVYQNDINNTYDIIVLPIERSI